MTVTRILAAWSLTLLLAACGGGYEGTAPPIDTSSQALKVVGATSVTLVPTEMGRIEITGGTRPYTATSSNATVALASVSDNILSVAAVRGDLTPITVSVTDAKNAKASLSVTVTNSPQQGNFALSDRVFSILPGASKTVTVSGGTGPYSATSITPRVASVSVNDNALTVTGLSEGANAEVKVFDSKGVTQTALVTVAAPIPSASGLALFSNMPANLSLRPRNSVTYTLGGGIPPYSVISSNTAVLSGEVRGAALILQPGIAGNATVTVTDGANKTLSQRIYVMTTAAPLTLSASSVSGEVGSVLTVNIAGGMPPYTATTTSTVLIGSGLVVNGDQLSISLRFAEGPGVITVKDSEGASATIDVIGVPLLSSLSVSPTAITIPESVPTTFPIRVMRGKAPYLVFTSHPGLLRPTISGDKVIVTSVALPCVSANTPVIITVLDASGATTTTTVTIQDSGPCP